jgi:hypothetical protein
MTDFVLDCVLYCWQGLFGRSLVGPGRSCQRWARILLVVLVILALSLWLRPELTTSRFFVIAALLIAAVFAALIILTLLYVADKELLSSSISGVESNETARPVSASSAAQSIARHNNEVVPMDKPRHT